MATRNDNARLQSGAESESHTTCKSTGSDYTPPQPSKPKMVCLEAATLAALRLEGSTMDKITVLHAMGGIRLTKLWKADGNVVGYDDAKNYRVGEIEVSSIRNFVLHLLRLQKKPSSCVIRGKFIGDEAAQAIEPCEYPEHYRRTNDNFHDQPLHMGCIDIDKYVVLGDIDPVQNPVEAINQYINTVLPACFRNVTYCWQLSGSAGSRKYKGILKAHIWFWLSTPRTSAEMNQWAKATSNQIDASLFRQVQIHYTANPVFENGVTDPVPVRVGLAEGSTDEVDLTMPSNLIDPDTGEISKATESDSELIRRVVSGENFHDSLLGLTARYASRNMSKRAILETITGFMDSVAIKIKDDRWQERMDAVPGMIDSAEKFRSGGIPPPEPLPALPAVLPFDYDYLPDALRGYVQDISERMQCPPDFAAVGVLVMMATIIGRKVGIRPMRQDDWMVIPNLWGAAVGNSGVMKSPTLKSAMSPIKKLQAEAFEVFNKAKAEYDAQAELAKVKESVNMSKAKASLKKDDKADVKSLLQSSEADDAPILMRYITNNASYEALGELLMENPNGLLVEADEIIGLLKQLDAGGQEVARSFYLTAADGDASYTVDRIIRGKGLHTPALCLSIIGGIQPGVLAEYVRQATGGGAGADGLLQRFGLMVYPDISPNWKEVDRYPDSVVREAVNLLAERLDNLNHAEIGAEVDLYGGVPYLRFDDAAQALFSKWRASLETRLRSGEEHQAIVSHLSKYRKLIPSLALINHLCDTRQGAVSEASLLRAIAFSEYLESHAQRIYSYATRPDIDAAKTLLKRLASGKLPDVFKARDISQKGWAGLETPSKAQSAINLLLEYHHLTEEEITTGGRPTTHYHWIKAGHYECIPCQTETA